MAYQKINYAVILSVVVLLSLSCKKLSKEYATARWEIMNPVTNTPYVGIPVRLILGDYRGSTPKYEAIWQGETNSQGIAKYTFKGYTNPSFGYLEEANLSVLGVGGIDYAIIRRPYAGGRQIDELNDFRYEIVPYRNRITHIKNNNCQGPGDIMRFRSKYIFTGSGNWSIWTPEHALYKGCIDNYTDIVSRPLDYIVTEIEVTRQNGTVEHFLDTSYIRGENMVDTIKIYY